VTKAKRLLSRLSAKSNQTSKNKEGERERVTIKTMTDVSSLRSKGEENWKSYPDQFSDIKI
jgi:hypothetical protein